MRGRLRLLSAAGLVIAVAAAIAITGGANRGASDGATLAPLVGQELPPAVAAMFTPPTAMSDLTEGVNAAGAEEWAQHAYPGNDIALELITTARADFKKIKARPAKDIPLLKDF